MESDALLLGRTTYEGFAEAWPSRDGEFADKFNNMPKYVVSSTRWASAEWDELDRDRRRDLAAEVAKLKEAHDGASSSTAAPPWCRRCSSRASSTSCG